MIFLYCQNFITLNKLKRYGIKNYNINTIYIAILYDFIYKDEIKDYVIELLEIYEEKCNDFIIDLMFENMTKYEILESVKKNFNLDISLKEELYQLDIIKYTIFSDILENKKEKDFYLDFSCVYSDFRNINTNNKILDKFIQKDLDKMEDFIYYLTQEDNKILLKNFNKYFKKLSEKVWGNMLNYKKFVTIDNFKKFGINYNINTIYIALSLNFMAKGEIRDYAIDLMEYDKYKDNPFIVDLIFNINDIPQYTITYNLNEIFNIKIGEKILIQEINKIKYLLFRIVKEKKYNCNQEFYGNLAWIYDDFVSIYTNILNQSIKHYICVKEDNINYKNLEQTLYKDLNKMESFIYFMSKKNNKTLMQNFNEYFEELQNKINE